LDIVKKKQRMSEYTVIPAAWALFVFAIEFIELAAKG
jgi:hypothetical protein